MHQNGFAGIVFKKACQLVLPASFILCYTLEEEAVAILTSVN